MNTRPALNFFYRCSVVLMAVTVVGLAAGCAWLFTPASYAKSASPVAELPAAELQTAYFEARLLLAEGQRLDNAGVRLNAKAQSLVGEKGSAPEIARLSQQAKSLSAQARQQYERAVLRLQTLRSQPDCPPEAFATLAESHLALQAGAKAQADLAEGLKRFPEDADLLLFQARLDAQSGRIDQGLAILEKALKAAPHRQAILELMSDLRLQKVRRVTNEKDLTTQVDALIEIYERMLETRQGLDRIPPLLVLSSLYLRTPRKERAVETAQEAIRIHPREVRCHLALGAAREALGQYAEALKVYRQVLVLDSTNADARKRIEDVIAAQGKSGAKRRFYGELAADFPDDKPFQIEYARALVEDKRWNEAEAQLKKILARWPGEAMSRLELARVWVALKRPEEAIAAVKTLSQTNKTIAPLANLSLAQALIAAGQRVRALKILDDFSKTDGLDNASVTLTLASLLLESGETDRAVKVLEAYHQRHSEDYAVSLLLVQAYGQKKRYDDAQRVLASLPEKVRKQKENDILHLQADLYRRQKKLDKALEILTTLMQRDKTDAQLVIETGTVCQDLGRHAEAEKLYRKAIALDPEEAETYNSLGYFYAETNQKLDEALELIQKAIKLKPGAGNIMDSLGWVLYRRGDFQGAVEKLQRAVELMAKTPDAVVYEHLGDALEKLGKTAEAREAWRKSLELDAESQSVRDKLAHTSAQK